MKVRHWSDSKNIQDMSITELVSYEVSSVDSERGVTEDCEARIVKLTEIVGKLAEMLPESAQRELAKDFFHWQQLR